MQIFKAIFDNLGILPTNLDEDLKKLSRTIEMPNVVGLSLTQAAAILKSMKLEYEIDGSGGVILWQSVAPNEFLFEGAIILLKM